ncbi:MAG: DciA family protein [Patescibacteria group bacterium]|jgi:hypothetical protein
MAQQIGNLLGNSINQAGISAQVGAAIVCNDFDRILLETLGQKIKKNAKALYVKNRTLTIAVLSSIVGQEIKLHEQEILEKLHKKPSGKTVERLRFLV